MNCIKEIMNLLAKVDLKTQLDEDDWVESFFVALKDRMSEVDSAEEVVLFYIATELLEYEVNNGGFAQAFMNLGISSQWIKWAKKGYLLFNKDLAGSVLERAVELAKKEKKQLNKASKSLESASAYFKLGIFSELNKEAGKSMFISTSERISIVKKYRSDFENF